MSFSLSSRGEEQNSAYVTGELRHERTLLAVTTSVSRWLAIQKKDSKPVQKVYSPIYNLVRITAQPEINSQRIYSSKATTSIDTQDED